MAVLALGRAEGRNVSFWYYPSAYGGTDIDRVVSLLGNHSGVVSSVMLGCGHNIATDAAGSAFVQCADASPGLAVGDASCASQAALCGQTARGLRGVGVRTELVLGSSNLTEMRRFFGNLSNVEVLVEIGRRYGAVGWNFDLEPQPFSAVADQQLFAAFLGATKPKLNAAGMRLTAATATWCTMTRNNQILAPVLDRILDMETYNANSWQGWLHGDMFGGHYLDLVPAVPAARKWPVDKVGPGLGCWPAKCGKDPCWSTTEASAVQRMQRITDDGVPEVAMFRLIQVTGSEWPEDWWWPLLKKFAQAPPAVPQAAQGCGPGRWSECRADLVKALFNRSTLPQPRPPDFVLPNGGPQVDTGGAVEYTMNGLPGPGNGTFVGDVRWGNNLTALVWTIETEHLKMNTTVLFRSLPGAPRPHPSLLTTAAASTLRRARQPTTIRRPMPMATGRTSRSRTPVGTKMSATRRSATGTRSSSTTTAMKLPHARQTTTASSTTLTSSGMM